LPKSLIKEAARRGKSEAERRDLQYQIDDAYYDKVDAVELERKRKREREVASQQRKERTAKVGRDLYILILQLGWFGLCVSVVYDRGWQSIRFIDDLVRNNDGLAYIAMFFIFFYGRKVIKQLMGVEENR